MLFRSSAAACGALVALVVSITVARSEIAAVHSSAVVNGKVPRESQVPQRRAASVVVHPSAVAEIALRIPANDGEAVQDGIAVSGTTYHHMV